jgi:transcription initiation factor TFIID subunit 13
MYGFGDSEIPDNETVELLESYLIEYIQNIAMLAYKRSKRRGFNEIKLKDLLYIIKNDKKKFYRVPSLLSFYEILKKTKRFESNLTKKGIKKHLKYLVQDNNK